MIKAIKVPVPIWTHCFDGSQALYRPLPDDFVTSDGLHPVKRKSLKGRDLEKLNNWIAGLSREKQ